MEIKEKMIGDNTYYVRAMNPFEALKLLGDLQRVITTSLGNAAEGEGEFLDKEVNMGAIVAGIGNKLDGETLMMFADRLIKPEYVSVRMAGESEPSRLNKVKAEEIFTGKIKDMITLMFFIIEVNYSDFFDLAQNAFGNMQVLLKK